MSEQSKSAKYILWTDAFKLLSKSLISYYKKNGASTGKLLFELLDMDEEFRSTNEWLSRYNANQAPSIDPMTIFASFNDPKLTDLERRRRLNQFLKILGERKIDLDIDFEGCPTPIAIKLMSVRSDVAQRQIWTLFRMTLVNRTPKLTKRLFANVKTWYGIDVPALTIFLFWIKPQNYLPLDSNTVEYLITSGHILNRPKTFEQYSFVLGLNLGDYVEFSKQAYQQVERSKGGTSDVTINVKNKAVYEDKIKISSNKLLAVRFGKEMDSYPKLIRTLKSNRLYQFYQCYTFEKSGNIIYEPKLDFSLYSQGQLDISISAIVGRNGSGKSTLVELFCAAINNLSYKHSIVKRKEIEYVENVFMELYFITTFLYRIDFRGNEITIHKYQFEDNTYSAPQQVSIDDFDFEEFFYTLVINYGLHGLNSKYLGNWINQVFHKNDGYQMPVNISPFRKDGNININSEIQLVKSRLLTLLLKPVDSLSEKSAELGSLRELKKGHVATHLLVKLTPEKVDHLFEKIVAVKKSKPIYETKTLKDASSYWKQVLETVCTVFGIKRKIPALRTKSKDLDYYAFAYIIKKLISITINHPKEWGKYFDINSNQFNNHVTYIKKLEGIHSHITFKLRQAINFLKFDHIRSFFDGDDILLERKVGLDDLSGQIENVIANNQDGDMKTIYLIPPPFMSAEILFPRGESFNDFSSGEKQLIYSVSTLVYHLANIDSVPSQKDLASFRAVNIIFDEVELYFHPEMQRRFISFMLNYLDKSQIGDGMSLNICFITHSPFILSDIPSHNILFLDEHNKGLGTFGANIHELLSSSFFLNEGFMGAFAQQVIADLALYLSKSRKKTKFRWDRKLAESVTNVVGEPLIQTKLRDMAKEKFEQKLSVENRIAKLKREIEELENAKNL